MYERDVDVFTPSGAPCETDATGTAQCATTIAAAQNVFVQTIATMKTYERIGLSDFEITIDGVSYSGATIPELIDDINAGTGTIGFGLPRTTPTTLLIATGNRSVISVINLNEVGSKQISSRITQ